MIALIGLQQIQVIVKLLFHQLLWKGVTRSLATSWSSALHMCSSCYTLVTKTTASTYIPPSISAPVMMLFKHLESEGCAEFTDQQVECNLLDNETCCQWYV